MATRSLILVRHGQYDLNSHEQLEGPLTKLGREQAVITGVYSPDQSLVQPYECRNLRMIS